MYCLRLVLVLEQAPSIAFGIYRLNAYHAGPFNVEKYSLGDWSVSHKKLFLLAGIIQKLSLRPNFEGNRTNKHYWKSSLLCNIEGTTGKPHYENTK